MGQFDTQSTKDTKGNTIEELKSNINRILESSMSLDNYQTFWDDTVDKLIEATDRIVNLYKSTDEYKINNKTGRELEDEAMNYYELPNISAILDDISKKRDRLLSYREIIRKIPKSDTQILNPRENIIIENKGSGDEVGWEKRNNIPRLQMLLYILENDLGLDLRDTGNIQIIEGSTDRNMMRKEPYIRITINSKNRIIYVCEEYGNATFIFNKHKVKEEYGGDVDHFDNKTKEYISEQIQENKGLGIIINQIKKWREKMNYYINSNRITESQEWENVEIPRDVTPNKIDYPDWESASSLSANKKINFDWKTIKNKAEEYRKDYPGWFKKIKPYRGPETEHYSPELVTILVKWCQSILKKEDYPDWESASSLSTNKKINAEWGTIKNKAEEYRQDHPEWFKEMWNKKAKAIYYSPQLVAILIEWYESILKKEDYPDWESASSLIKKKEIKSTRKTVKNKAEEYRQDHPEWFRNISNNTKESEHYSPELVAILKEYFLKIKRNRQS